MGHMAMVGTGRLALAGLVAGLVGSLAPRGENLYVSHRGRVTVLWLVRTAAGFTAADRRDLVAGLPSLGDHHNNDLAVGPDGLLYLGQGTARGLRALRRGREKRGQQCLRVARPAGPFSSRRVSPPKSSGSTPQRAEYRTFVRNRGDYVRTGRYRSGLKRAIGLAFAPGGTTLYVLGFGQIETTDLAPNAIPLTGVLWRIAPEGNS